MESSTARDVAHAFGVLLREIEAQVCLADNAGAQAFEKRDYEQVREALERAGKLSELRGKVMALQLNWEKVLGFPAASPRDPAVGRAAPVVPEPKLDELDADESSEEIEGAEGLVSSEPIRQACLALLEKRLKARIVRKKRQTTYVTGTGDQAIVLLVSKAYGHSADLRFWFGFHAYQDQFLASAAIGYLVLCCGSPDQALLVPVAAYRKWLDTQTTSARGGDVYWHIHLVKRENRFYLERKQDGQDVDLTEYVVR